MINEQKRMQHLAGINESVQHIDLLIDQLTNAMEEYKSAKEFAQEMHSGTGADKHKLEKLFDAFWELDAYERFHNRDKDWEKFIKDNMK